jgi:DNA invertase Pin-like site-specific DNA recombinase
VNQSEVDADYQVASSSGGMQAMESMYENSAVIPVLGATRESVVGDESTSMPRQIQRIERWATEHTDCTGKQHHIVKITEDPDTSGAISPFERPGLGPYLRRPLLDTWKVLVVPSLDRLTRSLGDFLDIWTLLETEDKGLVSLGEQMDFGTDHGMLMARQIVMFAEYERKLIRKRIKAAYDALLTKGQYPGNSFPFGYIPIHNPAGKGWVLEPHPTYAPVVVEICERVIAGQSLGSICRWLDSEGIPTPRNIVRTYGGKKPVDTDAQWNQTSLTKILKSPAIVGLVTVIPEARRDQNGKIIKPATPQALYDETTSMPIKRAEPLITREIWEQVKAILADNAARQGAKVNRSPLLYVAYCAGCGAPLHINKANGYKSEGAGYRYYICPNGMRKRDCDNRRMSADWVESWIEKKYLSIRGSQLYTEDEIIPAHDNSGQILELAEAIGHLETKIRVTRKIGGDVSDLEAKRQVLERDLDRLDTNIIPEQRIPRATGETCRQRWDRQTWNERNTDMRKAGIRAEAKRGTDGLPDIRLFGPVPNQPGMVL